LMDIKTSVEIAMERAEGLEAIPRMTHEYGRYWEQPKRMLCWYGMSKIGPGYVSNNHRRVEIIEDGAPDLGCSCCEKHVGAK
jgi:hypothetical protein